MTIFVLWEVLKKKKIWLSGELHSTTEELSLLESKESTLPSRTAAWALKRGEGLE